MSDEPIDRGERLEELFIADLLFGLTEEELAEFQSLEGSQRRDELNRLASLIALLDVARSSTDGARLPHALRDRIRSDAAGELPEIAAVRPVVEPPRRLTSVLPWAVSTVCLLIAALVVATSWPFGSPAEPALDPVRSRDRLIASATNLVRADWTAGPTPVDGARGDVVWSADEQRGYMSFQGMPVNDPAVEQYQLWIFDKNQDEATPVDGGVFDIASTGEAVVPIHAKLRVREPYMFAVTIEKPGGVVVSDRSRLPLLAKVP
jgi:hypothetical protein